MAVKFTPLDLNFILAQIKMAEAGQPPVNPLLSFGLREVAGTDNNLVAGQSTFGSTDQVFPTITDPLFLNGYAGTSTVSDAQPRLISNLIADQTTNNPAAVAAALHQAAFLGAGYQNASQPGADGVFGVTTSYTTTDAGTDGTLGTLDDDIVVTNTLTSATTVGTGTALGLHLLSNGADGVNGATTEYTVVNNGADGLFGTGDDVIDEWGANHVLDGAIAGSDDIVGLRRDLLHTLSAGADAKLGTADDIVTDDVVSDDVAKGNLATPTNASSSSSTIPGLAQSVFINNVTPDNGLSAPSNSWFTFFGQFFDHGLDMIDKGGSGTVFVPLLPSDPLYVVGGHSNFMILTRATNLPGPDGVLGTADDVRQFTNQTSPFVDQSQTYASDPSHQVFLREYMIGADHLLHSSGALLGHAKADGTDGMATWADLKANAANLLGFRITDADVGNVPLLATDAYGNFIAGAHGMPQLVVINTDGTKGLVEGNIANPVALDTNGYKAVRTGHAFINDMAHAASPVSDFGATLLPDSDTKAGPNGGLGQFNADGTAADPNKFYDNELLDAHFVAGDGRVNENIGLTAVQDIFHSEHERLLAQIKLTVQEQLNNGDNSFAGNWVLASVDLTAPNVAGNPIHVIQANEWNGERLFQAAKFGTETEYQHLVFEEFARYVDPKVHVFGGVNVHIDAAITSEFANVVYRFGHSMLDENVNVYQLGADGRPVIDPVTGQPKMTEEGLIQAFTNPLKFASDPNMTADLILGTVNQVSNSIDEFVTGSLRNNLLGLPLDLAALNITRGRDVGVAPLNIVRNQLYALTGEAQLKPYANWAQFGGQLKYAESLINFIAAYGKHSSITKQVVDATSGVLRDQTATEKRAAAEALIHLGTIGDKFNPADPASIDAYNFMQSQGAYVNDKTAANAVHAADGSVPTWSTGSVTGLDTVDMWIGGLAEKISLFGGQLGSTFEYVFRTQMEALQDGDRLYYLPRIEGTDYEATLQDNSLAQLIEANTGIKHLPGNIFLTPEYTIEAKDYFVTNPDGTLKLDASQSPIIKDPTGATWLHSPTGQLLVTINPDKSLQFLGENNFLGNTIVLGGTEGNDRLIAGAADDDTVYGDGGNDYIDGGGGNDFLFGGAGNDTLIGGQGDDTMHGDAGNDTMFGGDGIDNMFGGDGNDYMEGGRGNDIMLGGLGNDIIIGNEGQDELTGGGGDDWLESRGGQGDLMFGDSGAPTGAQPLYSGNDVMIGGVAGGDVMKGFSGDDIMVGQGSFTKFIGGLGFDWGSYEKATHGVSEDMNRKEFISPNGAEDTIRDVWQHTEGASGSAFDDVIIGGNETKLLATKDTLDNVNLIDGLQGFFAPGIVGFGAGNILLGGAGNDVIIGGGGDDVIDGDASLHVALTSYTAGAQIIRQIAYDPNGNGTTSVDAFGNLITGAIHAGNVDTAVFNDVFANYGDGFFGPFLGGGFGSAADAEGFLTINHRIGAAAAIPNVGKIDDGTDRIRNIERLQFSDITVSIDSQGNLLTSSDGAFVDFNPITQAQYDAVPVSTPSITEDGGLDPATTVTTGQTLTASAVGGQVAGVKAITDADGITTPITWQWQYNDILRGQWVDIAGAVGSTYKVDPFFDGSLGIRVEASYVDGKGYRETVISASTAAVSLPGNVNTAPTFVVAQQFNGVANTTNNIGQPFDYFSPLTSIFTDRQTASTALVYTAKLANGSPLADVGMTFTAPSAANGFAGEFSAPNGFIDKDGNLVSAGQLGVRVTATDPGGLAATSTFYINILPLDAAPTANPDNYSILENAILTVAKSAQGVLANDTDPDVGDTLRAQLVSGPAHGKLVLNSSGTFTYRPDLNYSSTDGAGVVTPDTFTYQAIDNFSKASNPTTVNITVTPKAHVVSASLLHDTGTFATDLITNDGTLTGNGYANSAVLASVDGATAVKIATANALGVWTGAPVLTDGKHSIVISETDGNQGSQTFGKTDTALIAFELDTTPPPLTVALVQDTGASATDGVTKNAALKGVGTPNIPVTITLTPVGGGLPTSAVVQTNAVTGAWTYTPVGLANGQYAVKVTGDTDIAGNQAAAGLTLTFDSTPPVVKAALGNDTGFSITDGITSDAAVTGSGDPLSKVFAAIDGGASTQIATANGTGIWSFSPVLPDGPHSIVFTETDLAGNIGFSAPLAFTLDRLPPPLTVKLLNDTGTSATDAITKDGTLTGIADKLGDPTDPAPTVQISVDGTFVASVATNAAGVWSFNPFANNAAHNLDGKHTVSVTSTDLAGNKITAATTLTLLTAPPAPPTIKSFTTALNAAGTGITSYTIAGSATAGSSIVLSNGAQLGTATATATGAWSISVTPPTGSSISTVLNVVTTDVAGNTSAPQLQGLVVGTSLANTLVAAGPAVPSLMLGLGGSDKLTGSTGDDTLDGGGGNDTMAGGLGNDTYIVVSAGDVVTEAVDAGTDTVKTTLNNYAGVAGKLDPNVENLTFTGTGNFTASGNNLSNVITGGAGADKLTDGKNDVGQNPDTLIGGAGNDTYTVTNAGDVIVELAGGGSDTVDTTLLSYALGANLEDLTFSGTGNFTGTGNNLANDLSGGAGNDTLDGGKNDAGLAGDTMAGGAGNDTYIVNNANDVVTEGAGLNSGTDTVKTSLASYTLTTNVENLIYTGTGNFAGTGNASANTITGGIGDDTLIGLGGSDTLIGGKGNDTYLVAAGDTVTELAAGGTDTVKTALNTYTLGANVENLTYTNAAGTAPGVGNFNATGNSLVNVITGGSGNDTLDGGVNTTGGDTLIGGLGDDTYNVRNASDVVIEGTGNVGDNDTVNAFINTYTLALNVEDLNFAGTGNFLGTGNAGANTITGGAGSDTLSGGAGADTLIGGAGADTLIGGAGADTLTGGAGADLFVLAKGDAGGDRITDFTRAQGDQIQFSGYAAGTTLGARTFAAAVTSYTVGADTFRMTGNITLQATDFKFV